MTWDGSAIGWAARRLGAGVLIWAALAGACDDNSSSNGANTGSGGTFQSQSVPQCAGGPDGSAGSTFDAGSGGAASGSGGTGGASTGATGTGASYGVTGAGASPGSSGNGSANCPP
jgi:hypothetical protein